MDFEEFLCEWYDMCDKIIDLNHFLGEKPERKTITKEL